MKKNAYVSGIATAIGLASLLYYFSPSLMYVYRAATGSTVTLGHFQIVMERHWVPYYQTELNGHPSVALTKVNPFRLNQHLGRISITIGEHEWAALFADSKVPVIEKSWGRVLMPPLDANLKSELPKSAEVFLAFVPKHNLYLNLIVSDSQYLSEILSVNRGIEPGN